MKDWIVETRVVSRRVYLVQAEDEKEAIFFSTHNPPEYDEDEYEETMSVVENVAGTSDGTCVRCGAAPRNASGLCATCVDEDAVRAGEVEDDASQALWRRTLDQERVEPTPSTDAVRRQAREEALEEAARVAERHGVYPELNVWGGGPEWYRHGQDIAKAIRALSTPPAGAAALNEGEE